MRSSKGQGTLLVLLFLAVGSLVIVPVLRYMTSGLRSQRIYEAAIAKEYAAQGVVEDALWKILNGLNLNPLSPAYGYTFERANVDIKIPAVAASQNYGSGDMHNLMLQVTKVPRTNPPYDPSVAVGLGAAFDPENWISGAGTVTIEYIFRIDTQKWQTLTDFGFTLPQGLTYVAGSSKYLGPLGNADLSWDTKVRMTDHYVQKKNSSWVAMTTGSGLTAYQEVTAWPPPGYNPNQSYLYISNSGRTLSWRPKITASGRSIFIQTLQVTGNPPPWGIMYATNFNNNQTGNVDKTAAIGIATYTIVVTVEGVKYEVVVAYDASTSPPTMKIISYNIVG